MDTMSKCLGIDLGTTNSEVCRFVKGLIEFLKSKAGKMVTPSRIGVDPDKSTMANPVFVSGTNLNNLSIKAPMNILYDSKRMIGRDANDRYIMRDRHYWPFELDSEAAEPTYSVKVSDGQAKIPAVAVSAEILKVMASYNTDDIAGAVIAVPAHFTERQVEQTMLAGRLAGLNVPRCLHEPVAAAIAYGYKYNVINEKVLVYDLGGGTFDCCIVVIENGQYRVLKSVGHSHLGGADFDNAIVEMVANALKDGTHRFDVYSSKKDLAKLKGVAERSKIALSSNDTHTLAFRTKDTQDKVIEYNSQLTRAEFEGMIKPKIDTTIQYIENILGACTMKPENIDRVLLVGGSTRIPYVRARLEEFFNRSIDPNVVDVEKAVAEGAAIYAHSLLVKGIDMCPNAFSSSIEYCVDGDALQSGSPYDIYFRVNGGELNRIIEKGTHLTPTEGKGFKRNRHIVLAPNATQLELDVFIQDENGQYKAIDYLTICYDEDDKAVQTERRLPLSFGYSQFGRLTIGIEDRENNKTATNSILLRGDELDDNQDYIHQFYSIRKRLASLMTELMEKGNDDEVVALRGDVMNAFAELRDMCEFIDVDSVNDFDTTVRGLEDRARQL